MILGNDINFGVKHFDVFDPKLILDTGFRVTVYIDRSDFS